MIAAIDGLPMKTLSIVVPVYNEEQNIFRLYTEVMTVLKTLSDFDYEFIFINDGSRDSSWALLSNLALKDQHVKCINFSRNFGHQIALTAGYDHAQGDVIISMDADLQDPPTLILEMLDAWKNGNQIVYARRINRDDGFLKKLT